MVVHDSSCLVVFDNVLVGFDSVFDIVLVVHGSGYFSCFSCFRP